MMKRVVQMSCVAAIVAFSADVQAQLPGTLNFADITATNVDQNTNDDGEKEVDFGDFDNDGDLDAVIGNGFSDFGARRNRLYRNDAGFMQEITGNPAIPGFNGTDVTRNAFLRDYDDDGWLDIIVINDRNSSGEAGRTKIFMNKQADGSFDRFEEEGLARLGAGAGGAACGGVSIDNDNDGDFDLYVGNYPNNSQDTMYLNEGNGNFVGVPSFVPSDGDYTVDVSSGDLNGDGKLDLIIANWGTNWVYYNDLNSTSTDVGDYAYTGSKQSLPGNAANENAFEPGDFDNDGDLDLYHSQGQGNADIIRVNNGTQVTGQVEWQILTDLPANVRTTTSRKATVVDLNQDGRLDIFVMAQSSRPTLLRNTTVNGNISFVDWTPGQAFNNSDNGWHSAAFDVNGDERDDIFLGGFNGDRLMVQTDSSEYTEADLVGGVIPPFHNSDPVAILGVASGSDTFTIEGVPSGRTMSVVLNSYLTCADLTLDILDSSSSVIESSNRGAGGIEEALQIQTPSNSGLIVRVTVNSVCGDVDNDGDLDVDDFDALNDCLTGGGSNCDAFDADLDGDVDFADVRAFQISHGGPNVDPSAQYILEILTRD